MTGPLGLPWSTFSAFVVIGASIVISIVWAVASGGGGNGGSGGGDDE
ncbi:MAG: hypothetical protein GF400_05920 [Candidatus Eisenbacteria bacterium]|nr:hypothetical protein [Candidatus Eisenbacteria bacterium]